MQGIRSTPKEWNDCIAVFLHERTIQRIVAATTLPHCRVEHMVQHIRLCM